MNSDTFWLFGIPALLIASVLVYFFPSILAWNHRQFRAIFAVNALLGWTVVGWIAAFVWSQYED